MACSTPYNARGLLKSAIREDNPVVFFEHVLTYNIKQEIPLLPYTLPLDKAEMAREGKDLTVLCYGKLRHVALEAAQQLAKLGVDAEVLDLISLKPLDMDSIKKSLKKTGRCLILDESSRTGGIGGEVFTQVRTPRKRGARGGSERVGGQDSTEENGVRVVVGCPCVVYVRISSGIFVSSVFTFFTFKGARQVDR